jgi:hypothetical protein
VKTVLWPVAAAAALAVLIFLALHGERENTTLVAFKSEGVMAAIAPESIAEVEVAAGSRHLRFVREAGGGWRSAESATPLGAEASARVSTAVNLLHDSAPQRTLIGAELDSVASFGLDPPALQVVLHGATPFSVSFGVANPIGLARYARVGGRDEVALLPGYVAEAWEQVLAKP